jgi:proteasome lid subunit RPN8/RPN11
MKTRISSTVLHAIRAHAAAEAPREACGLLFGTPDRVHAATATGNVADDPERHFEIDPAALFAAIRAERTGGPRIAGYYHSHPGGRAEPSETDREMAVADGKLWLIVASDAVTGWRAGPDGFTSVEIG